MIGSDDDCASEYIHTELFNEAITASASRSAQLQLPSARSTQIRRSKLLWPIRVQLYSLLANNRQHHLVEHTDRTHILGLKDRSAVKV